MKYSKKSHACEEGGAHIRIYFLHLLMKLKNNYLLRKLLKWANKKCKNFKINKVVFFLKNKENVLHLCTKNLDDIIYNSWDIGHDRLKLVILGHFLPFYQLKTWKSRILKKWKNLLQMSSFYTCTKNHNCMGRMTIRAGKTGKAIKMVILRN